MGFHNGTAVAVVGLPRKTALRKTTVQDKAKPVLMSYMEQGLKALPVPTDRRHEGALAQLVAVTVEFLVATEYAELLFGPLIYGRFEKQGQALAFFEATCCARCHKP